MREFIENKEINEWQSRFAWLNPAEVKIDGGELHWTKINQETALESFRALEKMRPFLDKANLFDDKNRSSCREKLALLIDANGARKFADRDLRFFDLYFGNDRIKIDRDENGFDAANGRHRLWLARQNGVTELPVLLNEKTTKENVMSNFELADIEKETLEQHEEVEEMETDIERHQERAEELRAALEKIRVTGAELGSDRFREVEQRAEQAEEETERRLEEIRRRRDELLAENQELTEKVVEQNEKRREVHGQVAGIKLMFEGASDEFKSQINQAGEALAEELENLAEAHENLLEARNKLEGLKV